MLMFRPFLTLLAVFVAVPASADDAKPAVPFNGTDLSGWKLKGDAKRSKWVVGHGLLDPANPVNLALGRTSTGDEEKHLVNLKPGGVDISTEQTFGDCTLELEFMIPKGSNSGVYMMGEYELQILDSFG